MVENRRLFETWYRAQLSAKHHHYLDDHCKTNGYKSAQTNALWVGFNAGLEFAKYKV